MERDGSNTIMTHVYRVCVAVIHQINTEVTISKDIIIVIYRYASRC